MGLVRRHRRTFGFIVQEAIDFGDCSIEDDDGKVVVGNVQDQILTHDSQTNEAEVSTGKHGRRSADIDAGQTGATVSPTVPSDRFRGRTECDGWENTSEWDAFGREKQTTAGPTAMELEQSIWRLTPLCRPS